MGTAASRNSHGEEEIEDGGQLYVSLKIENCRLSGELVPHIYGSASLVGAWDPSRAFPMERESTSVWELSFVVPSNHEVLDFKFLLKPKNSNASCIVEKGPHRQLIGGTLRGDQRSAVFMLSDDEVHEYSVFIKADRVSPFDLAASWRAYQDNFQPSTVRWIPDVSINSGTDVTGENVTSATLELDIEHYVIPAPAGSVNSTQVYAANKTETPRSLSRAGVFTRTGSSGGLNSQRDVAVPTERPDLLVMEASPPDGGKFSSGPAGLVESKSHGTFPLMQKQDGHRGIFVDRGFGSPKLVRSASETAFNVDLEHDSSRSKNSMPAAAGAVTVAAVADQMLGLKEDKHLAIVLVGLPARGKTFTAAKLTRYLRWLGHDTKHFNVGKYRRLKHGANQTADFFRGDNPEGLEARNEVAALAMEDMISWMQEGGQVGIFDATNSTRERRNMLMRMAEGKCKIIFLETICNDQQIIERNIRLKVQQSPDYAEETDFEAGYHDFKVRLENYEKVYEPVEEGSYIKMIDMVTGNGGQLQVNNISGYLPGRIVFILVCSVNVFRRVFFESLYYFLVVFRYAADVIFSSICELR
ncbi:hypothetical protein M569_09404 [Genlisea aurea]|uniref:CBM20 domain-containing protein n=1 Tax=Genlisea aurea TaxID=192259 RepID=S8DQR1_9LAMI|nr:hypothetical protein M569_09404 [Genlisea aurea]